MLVIKMSKLKGLEEMIKRIKFEYEGRVISADELSQLDNNNDCIHAEAIDEKGEVIKNDLLIRVITNDELPEEFYKAVEKTSMDMPVYHQMISNCFSMLELCGIKRYNQQMVKLLQRSPAMKYIGKYPYERNYDGASLIEDPFPDLSEEEKIAMISKACNDYTLKAKQEGNPFVHAMIALYDVHRTRLTYQLGTKGTFGCPWSDRGYKWAIYSYDANLPEDLTKKLEELEKENLKVMMGGPETKERAEMYKSKELLAMQHKKIKDMTVSLGKEVLGYLTARIREKYGTEKGEQK